MASHGVPRTRAKDEKSAEARTREAKEIKRYQGLVEDIESQVRKGDFTPDLLQKTAEILQLNPEYYTVWNHRRRIYAREFRVVLHNHSQDQLTADNRDSQILDIIRLDLGFLLPLLIRFPKCYWIWNHRVWLLEQATFLLPVAKARSLWEEELRLVSEMLNRDNRNFHGWTYRRTIIGNLESKALDGKSMAMDELDYSTKMISANLSNFSAWHNRTKLISRVLDEKSADDVERKQVLNEELAFIHKALFDPYDQSLWFYHQNLLCAFDLDRAPNTLAPHLSNSERLEYLCKEMGFIQEMLDDFNDCKWIYQALIDCRLLVAKIQGSMAEQHQTEVKVWLNEVKKLDQLRKGRWVDLEQKLGMYPLHADHGWQANGKEELGRGDAA